MPTRTRSANRDNNMSKDWESTAGGKTFIKFNTFRVRISNKLLNFF